MTLLIDAQDEGLVRGINIFLFVTKTTTKVILKQDKESGTFISSTHILHKYIESFRIDYAVINHSELY